jgi:hypothetical protein
LSPFVRKAWRRPVARAEVDKLIQLVNLARANNDTFENGVKIALKAILVSPHFLFRIEADTMASTDGTRELSDHELASRLSYFLWSSMPDDALFQLADAGTLKREKTLSAQVHRMLASPKAMAFSENFAGQWLELRNLAVISPDPARFPDFGVDLRQSMKKETTLFFDSVLRNHGPITDFIDGRYTFLNESLAHHYGIPGIEGTRFRRVEVDGIQRSGVLTQASVLTVTSHPTRTSPVLRGLWVLENVLGNPPPPPPPNVPRLAEEKISNNLSMRQQLEQHRSDPTCASCHTKMDALGFGLENYDGIGQWRTQYGETTVDPSGALPGSRLFSTPAQLKSLLMEDKDTFAECLTEKVLTYALGRGIERDDRPTVAAIARKVAARQYRFSAMIEEIVLSPLFRQRRVATASDGLRAASKKG